METHRFRYKGKRLGNVLIEVGGGAVTCFGVRERNW